MPPSLWRLDELAAARPNDTALIWGDTDRAPWSWAELAARVGGACAALSARGVSPGDRIAVVGGNGPEWIVLREAAEWLGLSFVPISPRLTAVERNWLLANSEARWAFAAPELVDAEAAGPVHLYDWREPTQGPPQPLPPRPLAVTAQQLLYTSGSSGYPKGVLRAAASDDRRARQSVDAYGLTAQDTHLIAGPLYHSGPAIFYRVFRQLGAPQVVFEHFDAAAVARWLTSGRVQAVFMVPTMWRMVLESVDNAEQSRLRLAWSAGSPLDVATRRALIAWLGEGVLWEFYGATETGTVTILPPSKQRSHAHTVGFAAPGVSIQVRDTAGRTVAPGEPGRIYVRSPAAMLDYHRGPGSPADLRADRDGDWLSVGDRGHIEPDGALVLYGREDGMLISGGINIHPEEVEAALRALPGVREAVVLGLRDAVWGQALAAVVEPSQGAVLQVDALAAALRTRLAGFKIPKRWAIAAIPRTASGKVRRDAAALAPLLGVAENDATTR